MSGDDLPGGFPERNSDPRDDRTGWERDRPGIKACPCGKPAWVFPGPGLAFCGMCPASPRPPK